MCSNYNNCYNYARLPICVTSKDLLSADFMPVWTQYKSYVPLSVSGVGAGQPITSSDTSVKGTENDVSSNHSSVSIVQQDETLEDDDNDSQRELRDPGYHDDISPSIVSPNGNTTDECCQSHHSNKGSPLVNCSSHIPSDVRICNLL